MRVIEDNYGWAPIETSPFDEDITVQVTDGQGAPYRLPFPCRRTAAGWVSSSKGTLLTVTPMKWKTYRPIPKNEQPPLSTALARGLAAVLAWVV
jgi:hypothetical protein